MLSLKHWCFLILLWKICNSFLSMFSISSICHYQSEATNAFWLAKHITRQNCICLSLLCSVYSSCTRAQEHLHVHLDVPSGASDWLRSHGICVLTWASQKPNLNWKTCAQQVLEDLVCWLWCLPILFLYVQVSVLSCLQSYLNEGFLVWIGKMLNFKYMQLTVLRVPVMLSNVLGRPLFNDH